MSREEKLASLQVTSASPLDEECRKEILSMIAEREFDLSEEVDPELLGGFVAEVHSLRFDYSLKSRLKRAERLVKDEVKRRALRELAAAQNLEESVARNRAAAKELLHSDELSSLLKKLSAGEIHETGTVLNIADGVCYVDGLPSCKNQELVLFEDESYGLVMNLEPDKVGIVLLDSESSVLAGDRCISTGRTLEVPVGKKLLGRIVDALGQAIDGLGPVETARRRPVESPSAAIIDRQEVNRPLYTGITSIDAMIPIGRGQRELIIGDRRCGKTSIAVDTIIRQKDQNVACVYVAIGQRMSAVAEVVRRLKSEGAMDYTTVVVASASDSAAMQYLAPYSACAMAEELMYEEKRDVLIVYDDLSKHAVAYRALSLLLRRPPGREAYPGDIFYIHSRLLERSARLSEELGGASITALPIIETLGGNISAYVPTNVISITDGQIFLDTDRFFSGQKPAVNEGLSVSRVGGAAQTKAMKKVAGSLRLLLSQAAELESFSKLNSDSDASTKIRVKRGRLIKKLLCQGLGEIRRMSDSVFLLHLSNEGALDFVEEDKADALFRELLEYYRNNARPLIEKLEEKKVLEDEDKQAMLACLEQFKAERGLGGEA